MGFMRSMMGSMGMGGGGNSGGGMAAQAMGGGMNNMPSAPRPQMMPAQGMPQTQGMPPGIQGGMPQQSQGIGPSPELIQRLMAMFGGGQQMGGGNAQMGMMQQPPQQQGFGMPAPQASQQMMKPQMGNNSGMLQKMYGRGQQV